MPVTENRRLTNAANKSSVDECFANLAKMIAAAGGGNDGNFLALKSILRRVKIVYYVAKSWFHDFFAKCRR